MIDLTQGEGNKRVRKRNKKPTKAQLAAQAAAEAYRASARLPGQGDGSRPESYPPPSHAQQSRSQIAEEDIYQAPPMQTNFTAVDPTENETEEPHRSPLRSTSSSQHAQPSCSGISISPRQRQRPEQLLYQYPSTSTDHHPSPMSLHHQNTAQQPLPLSSSHDSIRGLDANIDPTLCVMSKDGLGSHAVTGPNAEAHHDLFLQRGGPMPSMQLPLNTHPIGHALMPRDQSVAGVPHIQQQQPASANRPAQLTLPHLSLAPPSRSTTYHHQFLPPHQGTTTPNTPQAGSATTPHLRQHSPSAAFRHPELQPTSTLPQADTSQVSIAASQQQPAFAHDQAQARRLPPMRTLSESPAPTTAQRQRQDVTGVTGFARFAARAPTGFANPAFGKPTMPTGMPVRPLLLSEDKGKQRVEGESGGASASAGAGEGEVSTSDHAGRSDERRSGSASGGSRRHFVPPSPRVGIEYVQRADDGLITARRTSGRHNECTVDWLNRVDRGDGESRSAEDGHPARHQGLGLAGGSVPSRASHSSSASIDLTPSLLR
jgi:hypothetical protein